MTLKQAFKEWAEIPQNTSLASRSRFAVEKVLMKEHGDDDVRQFTAFYTRKLMQECKLQQPLKTQAASILVHVLKYAAINDACVMPDFDFSIAGERQTEDTIEPSGSTPVKALVQEAPKAKAPESPSMGKRHGGGRPKVPVVKVDPQTGEVLSSFNGMVEASLSVGANKSGVANAIKKGRMCKGFYWFPADTKKTKIKMFIAGKVVMAVRKKISTIQDKSCPGSEAVGRQENKREGAMPQTTSEAPTTRTPLSSFSDEELKAELANRGWKGTLYKHLIF